ncbi:MAG TPA: histidinol dehydrogenase, partial [Acetobacteraceae bacterium]|nr:histidinol dehydrogenase [Acetobacteraceae bacterium]
MKRLDAAAADFEAVFAGLLNSADQAAPSISRDVAAIIAQVRSQGDAALFALTAQFDRTAID